MNGRARIWMRTALAGGLVFSLAACGYIEDLIEDSTTADPADISGFDDGDAATYGKVATEIGLLGGLTEGFGSGASDALPKGGVALLAPVSGQNCPDQDVAEFDPDLYDPADAAMYDKVTVTYTYEAADSCTDTNGNDLTGVYTVTGTDLADETWPATIAEFTDFLEWSYTGANFVYDFDDMSAVLAGPGLTTNSNGKLNVAADATTQVATSSGSIRTTFDDGSAVLSAIISKVDLTKTLGATESTTGTFRIAVTLFGYLDVTLTAVVVDDATCANHPVSRVVDLVGDNTDMVSLDFGTGTCNTADVTLADGSTFPGTVIPAIF